MSLAKNVAKFIAATLFTSFLSLLVLLMSLHDLMGYSTLKSLSKDQFLEQKQQINAFIEQSCKNSKRIELPIQNEQLSFECSEVKDADSLFDKVFDRSYYKNYSCPITECVKQPSVLASAFGNKLVSDALFISGIMALLSGLVLFLLLEQRIKGLGISLIFVGMNYFTITFLENSIPPQMATIINSIFSSTMTNFLYILVAGIVLAAIGFYTKK